MAPTHSIRKNAPAPGGGLTPKNAVPKSSRAVLITAGSIQLRARLLDTPTAERIWQALPIWSTAERWGEGALHFSTRIDTGREATAVWNVTAGQIAYWVEDDRVIIGYDTTPISRPGEIRLPAPGNIWAETSDDVTLLRDIPPGTRVDVVAIEI